MDGNEIVTSCMTLVGINQLTDHPDFGDALKKLIDMEKSNGNFPFRLKDIEPCVAVAYVLAHVCEIEIENDKLVAYPYARFSCPYVFEDGEWNKVEE